MLPSWLETLILQVLGKYITPELLKQLETQAAIVVVAKLRELAKDTTQTKIDDAIVEIIAAALGVP